MIFQRLKPFLNISDITFEKGKGFLFKLAADVSMMSAFLG
jgi:hypothetical protein